MSLIASSATKRPLVAGVLVTILTAALVAACHGKNAPTENKNPNTWISVEADTSDLPIPVDTATFSATYTIDNLSCLKPRRISGAIAPPFISLRIDAQRVSPKTFRAKVAADRFEDEDYDGLGPCHWRLASVDFTLKHEARQLTAGMDGKSALGFSPVKNYFSDWSITSAPTDEPQPGLTDPDAARAGNAGKIYVVTVKAKEAAHD